MGDNENLVTDVTDLEAPAMEVEGASEDYIGGSDGSGEGDFSGELEGSFEEGGADLEEGDMKEEYAEGDGATEEGINTIGAMEGDGAADGGILTGVYEEGDGAVYDGVDVGDMGEYAESYDGDYEGMSGEEGYDAMMEVDGDAGSSFEPMASWGFIIGMALLAAAVSVGLGILFAKLRIKKGIDPYDD
ncbi:MAG: hypothetical protein ILP10_05430 [Lachnospiraceae bacterium]|nr:hypothetical protein [Lachnospiraceae bacterium]